MIDKIIYRSKADEIWGEYVLNYIFFIKKNLREINFNPEEIEEIFWIKKEDLIDFLKEKKEKSGELPTPWFSKIVEY